MRRFRIKLLTLSLLLAGGLFTLMRKPPTPAYADESHATAGQLTILDKAGKPAGLCPLQHTDVNASIAGYVSRVTVQQEFANPSKEPIEAIYTFPLPEDAAVDDMTMHVGTRVIKAQIMKREEAREVYEAAKAEGQRTALLDQERPNIFTQSVANIMPGDRVTITISYVNLLKYADGYYEFVFPMVVGPRYTPGGGYTEPGKRGAPSPQQKIEGDPGSQSVVTDADKITPPITPQGTRAGHDISVTVNLDAGLPIQDVKSVLHRVDVQPVAPTRAVIRLVPQDNIPNKDFILRFSTAGSVIQEGLLTYAPSGGQSGYFSLILEPPMAPPQKEISPKEMVFVIDQTGSQSGWPIQKAKETMKHCIQNLNPGDTFQLLGFNTELYPCFPAPVEASPETIAKALKFLAPIEGSGGTDILKSVDYALKLPDGPNRLRIVCYMTDGYVGNDMQIIDYIGKHRGRARMFPFGVGNSVNRFLIDGMAREGRGAAEYVTLNTPGEVAASRFYHRIASPLLLDVHVDWNGLPVEDVYPKYIPDVFSAQPIVIKGRYTRAAEGDITIRGLLRGQPWSRTIHVAFPPVDQDGSEIATMWARERIEDLQSQDWLGAQKNTPDPKIKDAIIATALEYRLMSQYTSFVAVEEHVVNSGGKQRTIDVPVEMPQGVSYEGIFGRPQAGGVMLGGRMSLSRAATPYFAAGAVAGKPAAPALNVLRESLSDKDGRESEVNADSEIASGSELAQKKLAAMKPDERRAALERAKLSAHLRKQLESWRKAKAADPKATPPSLEVQIWLNALPNGAQEKLKSAGFDLSATLIKDKLLLGTVSLDKLDAILELSFVRRVEAPRVR